MKDLLNQISSKEMMSTTKRMGYINNFTKVHVYKAAWFVISFSFCGHYRDLKTE